MNPYAMAPYIVRTTAGDLACCYPACQWPIKVTTRGLDGTEVNGGLQGDAGAEDTVSV